MATGMCPECMKFMLFEQLMLTNTKDSFPKLGREVTEATPTTCYLQVMTCPGDGKSFARWLDLPGDPLRRFDHKTLAWLD